MKFNTEVVLQYYPRPNKFNKQGVEHGTMKLSLRRIVAGVYIVLVLIVIVVAMWSTTHKVCCSHCCSVITDLPETADSDDHGR